MNSQILTLIVLQALIQPGIRTDSKPAHKAEHPKAQGKILVGSQTGTCSALGASLVAAAAQHNISLELQDLLDYEPEQLLQEKLILLLVSTYEDGAPPTSAKYVQIYCEDHLCINAQSKPALIDLMT